MIAYDSYDLLSFFVSKVVLVQYGKTLRSEHFRIKLTEIEDEYDLDGFG